VNCVFWFSIHFLGSTKLHKGKTKFFMAFGWLVGTEPKGHRRRISKLRPPCTSAPLSDQLMAPRSDQLMAPRSDQLMAPRSDRLMAPLSDRLMAPRKVQLIFNFPPSTLHFQTLHYPFITSVYSCNIPSTIWLSLCCAQALS
jgi:hypothetical protein